MITIIKEYHKQYCCCIYCGMAAVERDDFSKFSHNSLELEALNDDPYWDDPLL